MKTIFQSTNNRRLIETIKTQTKALKAGFRNKLAAHCLTNNYLKKTAAKYCLFQSPYCAQLKNTISRRQKALAQRGGAKTWQRCKIARSIWKQWFLMNCKFLTCFLWFILKWKWFSDIFLTNGCHCEREQRAKQSAKHEQYSVSFFSIKLNNSLKYC